MRGWRRAVLLALALVAPAEASVESDGTSTQHIGGAGGRQPASGDRQTYMAWVSLQKPASGLTFPTLILVGDNRTPTDGMGLLIDVTGGTTVQFVVLQDSAITDTATCLSMTVGAWYHLAIQRAGSDTYRCFAGTESRATSLVVTHTRAGNTPQHPGFGIGLLGNAYPSSSPVARIERWKHYTAALTAAQIDAERCSLAPSRTAGLFSYSPLTTAGAYDGVQGSTPYTFATMGGGGFSTHAGPRPSCGRTSARPGGGGVGYTVDPRRPRSSGG